MALSQEVGGIDTKLSSIKAKDAASGNVKIVAPKGMK